MLVNNNGFDECGGQIMKKLYIILRIVLWSFAGVFIGSSLFKWHDYKTHPDLYAMQSAPWYLSIEINAIFTIIVVIVILTVMWIIRKNAGKTTPDL